MIRLFVLVIQHLQKMISRVKNSHIKPFCKIPGPVHLPVVGSQWLYFWFGPYSLDKLHLANEGNIVIQFQVSLHNSSCFHIPCLIT